MAAGRHRSFDKNSALENAMRVFWKNGYPGTSLTDLTNAMGINKPSLYATFGNKEELFNQSVNLYLTEYGGIHIYSLTAQTGSLKERIKNYLKSIACMLTNPELPLGCLICISTSEIAGSRLPDSSAVEINNINKQTVHFLTDFFEQEKLKGNLNPQKDAMIMANYLLTLQFGLAVSARNGANRDELMQVINFSIEMFN